MEIKNGLAYLASFEMVWLPSRRLIPTISNACNSIADGIPTQRMEVSSAQLEVLMRAGLDSSRMISSSPHASWCMPRRATTSHH